MPKCVKIIFLQACYVSAMWKKSVEVKPMLPSISCCGWRNDGSVVWTEEIYPEEIKDILLDDKYDDNDDKDDNEDEGESDDEQT